MFNFFQHKIWQANIKHQMLALLLVFALTGIVFYGLTATLPQLLISVLIATSLDAVVTATKKRKFIFSGSAVITGLIIAEVLPPASPLYIVAVASIVAIGSKHLIQINNRYVFNPAGFGLLFSLLVFRTYLHWWGMSLPWLVIVLGLLLAIRFKRLHLVLSFLFVQWLILSISALSQGQPVLNNILLTNFFFVSVMLIEPKTSPLRKNGRIIFGLLCGIFFSAYLLMLSNYDPAVLALISANIFVPILNRFLKS